MAVYDLTLIQSMLGKEICFIDMHSYALIKKQFKKYRWEYEFGYIDGFTVDLDNHSDLHFSILVNGDYYSLDASAIEILYLS